MKFHWDGNCLYLINQLGLGRKYVGYVERLKEGGRWRWDCGLPQLYPDLRAAREALEKNALAELALEALS